MPDSLSWALRNSHLTPPTINWTLETATSLHLHQLDLRNSQPNSYHNQLSPYKQQISFHISISWALRNSHPNYNDIFKQPNYIRTFIPDKRNRFSFWNVVLKKSEEDWQCHVYCNTLSPETLRFRKKNPLPNSKCKWLPRVKTTKPNISVEGKRTQKWQYYLRHSLAFLAWCPQIWNMHHWTVPSSRTRCLYCVWSSTCGIKHMFCRFSKISA